MRKNVGDIQKEGEGEKDCEREKAKRERENVQTERGEVSRYKYVKRHT